MNMVRLQIGALVLLNGLNGLHYSPFSGVVAASSPSEAPDCFSCSENNPCNMNDTERENVYFSHCDSSSMFIHCDEAGSCFERDCVPGTKWDQSIMMCTAESRELQDLAFKDCFPSSSPTKAPTKISNEEVDVDTAGFPPSLFAFRRDLQKYDDRRCEPSSSPSMKPSMTPSSEPSLQPSSIPSAMPTSIPSSSPSVSPSGTPSSLPSLEPSTLPSAMPTSLPSLQPSSAPSSQPSTTPSAAPSSQPTAVPSSPPSLAPSAKPSSMPSAEPTVTPSASPSLKPTVQPSSVPSALPSVMPSLAPSSMPTVQPSSMPSVAPSAAPSSAPSVMPTFYKCEMSREERRTQMIEIMKTVSDPIVLLTDDTPQNLAMEWIIEQDPYCVCPQDFKFVQRYILAVFYFSTGGGTWNECNAPSNYTDEAEVAQANAGCTIVGDGPDAFEKDIFQGTDAWLTPSYECYWGGLACANSTLCLDRIEFETDGLSGTLPSELKNLTDLRFLIVEEGTTEGTIPTEYGLLQKLIILDLNFNKLNGTIPEEIYGIPILLQLDLNDNVLTGPISSNLANAQYLQFIQLEVNQLTGTIPSSVGNLKYLVVFEVFDNLLTGSMPESVCKNRNNSEGFITRLTADCDETDNPRVDCEVPACCTDCPF